MVTRKCYVSFMLRLRLLQNDQLTTWVASTESAQTGETRWFPNVDALLQFIREEFRDFPVARESDWKGIQDTQTPSSSGQGYQAPDGHCVENIVIGDNSHRRSDPEPVNLNIDQPILHSDSIT